MGLDATKPVFGVSDNRTLKPVSLASETNLKVEFSPVATLQKVNNKGDDQSAGMRRLACAFVVSKPRRQVFSRLAPYGLWFCMKQS